MASITGAKPLPFHRRLSRFVQVGWTFLRVYIGYKRIQRKKGLTAEERDRRYS